MTNEQHEENPNASMVAMFEGGEVWIAEDQWVIVAEPHPDEAHDCEEMGCGDLERRHVVYRTLIPGGADIIAERDKLQAKYDAHVDAFNLDATRNVKCHWCGNPTPLDAEGARHEHYTTCPKSPLVAEVARLRACLELVKREGGEMPHVELGRWVDEMLEGKI